MRILVVSDEPRIKEFKQKFGDSNQFFFYNDYTFPHSLIREVDVVFDVLIDSDYSKIEIYQGRPELAVFLNVVKTKLSKLKPENNGFEFDAIGFNGLPTMINREYLEVSVPVPGTLEKLAKICGELNSQYLVVDDQVGMVTPRVITMIINEAYFTVQDGTATRNDIDLGMKLGTNYPYGPFEWCSKLGLNNVYETLQAMRDDTQDERYTICPLMEEEYRVL